MENISRKDLDRISQILANHVNTDESINLADKLSKADIIPKLYVYTYFKKIYTELSTLKVYSRDFDYETFESFLDESYALGLTGIKNKRELRIIFNILIRGFERENTFCDFDDSKFHSQTKKGECQNYDHHENDHEDACNINLTLRPVYFPNEDIQKFMDEPEWWCADCCENNSGGEDYGVECDMKL